MFTPVLIRHSPKIESLRPRAARRRCPARSGQQQQRPAGGSFQVMIDLHNRMSL
jgi:hypothetical protein